MVPLRKGVRRQTRCSVPSKEFAEKDTAGVFLLKDVDSQEQEIAKEASPDSTRSAWNLRRLHRISSCDKHNF